MNWAVMGYMMDTLPYFRERGSWAETPLLESGLHAYQHTWSYPPWVDYSYILLLPCYAMGLWRLNRAHRLNLNGFHCLL